MNTVTFAAIVLAANLGAAPEKGAKPEAAKAAPVAEKATAVPAQAAPAEAAAKPATPEGPAVVKPKPAKPGKASKEAIKDAQGALLGPCSPEMAGAKVKAVSVIDGKAMNAILDEQKSKASRADVSALFMAVEYEVAGAVEKDYRQVSTAHQLTTAQAQVLVGQPMCVFGKEP